MNEPARDEASGASLPALLARRGARRVRQVTEVTGVSGAAEAIAEEAVVRAIESEVFERSLARVLQGPVVEGAVEDAITSPAVERAVGNALDSDMVDRLLEQALEGDQMQMVIKHLAEAPEIRAAVAAQGVGMVEDLGHGARGLTRRLDTTSESMARRLLRRPQATGPSVNAGPVTRALAFGVDLATLINLAFLGLSAVVAFIVTVISGEGNGASTAAIVAGAGAWLLAGALYFGSFWALAGQTPGMRFLGIQLDVGGERRIGVRRAFKRLIGTVAAFIPFGLGFLGLATDGRCRGWHDRLAGTEVHYGESGQPS